MKKLSAAQQRFLDHAVLIAAMELVFSKLETSDFPIYPLGEIANATSGGTPDRRTTSYYGGNIPWIKSGELNDGLIEASEEYLTEEGLQNSSAKIYPKGTLVVALYGATVGKTGILAIDAASNQAVCAIMPKTNGVSRDYLFWFLRYKRPTFLKHSFGGAQPNISQKVLKETNLPVPDIELQEKIVQFLEVIERRQHTEMKLTVPDLPPPLSGINHTVARIEELAAKVEEARGLRRETIAAVQVITHACARKLLSTTNAEVSEIRYWLDPKRDGVQTGPFGAQLSSNDFTEVGIPILTIGNIQYGGLKLNELKYVSEEKARQLSRFTVKPGDILFARMGTVGRCCVVPHVAEGWLFNYHIIRLALDKSKVDPRFVHWSIQSSLVIEEYLDEKIRGATRQGVNSAIVAALPVRIPPLPEQHRIVAYLDDLQARIDAVKRLQAETQAELDGLLPSILDKAFRGELA